MADTWGNRVGITIFGESHGAAVGVVVDGLPAGFEPNMSEVSRQMARFFAGLSSPDNTGKSYPSFWDDFEREARNG